MSPDEIRSEIHDANLIANDHGGEVDRANMLILSALTEAVLHLADIIGRDRVF